MSVPIVLIHSFNHSYLPISLWKLRETNPESPVYLIGDGWNKHFAMWVKHEPMALYMEKANELRQKFKNFSTNPAEFELICLQRWLILESFMERHQIDSCLYLDSDVLVYDRLEKDFQRFSGYGMTVAGISGHSNFIQGRDTLRAFCRFIESAYSSEAKILELEEKYRRFRETHSAGGISDMTFFTEFREAYPGKVLDIAEPIAAKAFDITITYTKGMKEEQGLKKLSWKNGKPIAQTLDGMEVEMRSLHFQGASKSHMPAMAQIQSRWFPWFFAFNSAYLILQKAIRKLI